MDKLFKEVSVKKLYKDCLLLARFYGQREAQALYKFVAVLDPENSCFKQGNEKVLVGQVRQQFKANMREVDDDKIKEQKEAAIRALHNLHLMEAEKYVRDRKK